MQRTINKLVERQHLESNEAREAMGLIMSNQVTPAQVAAFMTALRMKGETPEEIAGCALAMRDKAVPLSVRRPVVDTCGTGGDRLGTFNISTTVAFVVAGAGVAVAKHGNRSVSSKSGSADVLEALGVKIDLAPELVERCLAETGIGFLFAPTFHRAMKYAAGPRKELGFRSIFNLLGPLTNPAGAKYQIVGVYQRHLTPVLARALLNIGIQRAMVVHGADGMDEITLTGTTFVSEVRDGSIRDYQITPEELGLERCTPAELTGGTAEDNAVITKRVLSGEERGPKRQVVLLNAAAALCLCDKAGSLQEGVLLAAEIIDHGLAMAKLEQLISASSRLAGEAADCAFLQQKTGADKVHVRLS